MASEAVKYTDTQTQPYRALVDPDVKEREFINEIRCSPWREKVYVLARSPYRKPTQVDEERILRPTEEALLRNSAKRPRNFGRRGA